jgi:hypothetical protein
MTRFFDGDPSWERVDTIDDSGIHGGTITTTTTTIFFFWVLID